MSRYKSRPDPRLVRNHPLVEFEVDGPAIRFVHITIYGTRFETTAPRVADRGGLAAAIAMGLHLAAEDAFALADEVMRRVDSASTGVPSAE